MSKANDQSLAVGDLDELIVPSPPSNNDKEEQEEEKEEIQEDEDHPVDHDVVVAANSDDDSDGSESIPKPDDDIAENPDPDPDEDEVKSPPPPTLEDIERDFAKEPDAEPTADPEPAAATAAAASPTAAPQESSSPETSTSRTKYIILGFFFLLIIVVALQSVIIGLLVNGDDDGDSDPDGVGRDVDDLDDTESSPSPSAAPTLGAAFLPLVSNPDARRLTQASTCDDCREVLPLFELLQYDVDGSTALSASVSANGFVDLACAQGNCATIDVISTDLNPTTSGEIFILSKSSSSDGNDGDTTATTSTKQMFAPVNDTLVISWEEVQLHDAEGDEGTHEGKVNAQVTLFGKTGVIEICWGDGDVKGQTFRSGVWNIDTSVYYPATGAVFDSDGFSNEFPSNTCQRFFDGDDGTVGIPVEDQPPIPFPTASPALPPISDDAGFVRVANLPGAREIISSCDDCIVTVPLPSTFLYLNVYPVRTLEVSSNGRITIADCGISNGTSCAVISVVNADLHPGLTDEGGVWVYDTAPYDSYTQAPVFEPATKFPTNESYTSTQLPVEEPAPNFPPGAVIISWEKVAFCCGVGDSPNDLPYVNAQAHIYPNGQIDMCWGDARLKSNQTFTAGILDLVEGVSFPATGQFFDDIGVSIPGRYPTYTCQTFFGSYSPSPPPSPSPDGGVYPGSFLFLSNFPDSRRLTGVSSCDDCEELISLPLPYPWFGNSLLEQMTISSNGQIRVDGCQTGDDDCGLIDVAFSDLDPSISGNVYFWDGTRSGNFNFSRPDRNGGRRRATTRMKRHNGDKRRASTSPISKSSKQELFDFPAYIISWENVTFHGDSSSYINAQARFFVNGTIELCWGPGVWTNRYTIAAGISAPRYRVSMPATGGPFFDRSGVTGQWPANLCHQFSVHSDISVEPTLPPISQPDRPPITEPFSCRSTTGSCVQNYTEFANRLGRAGYNDTISVCGAMEIPRALEAQQSSITICCNDNARCTLVGLGGVQILSFTGANVTISGLTFQHGFTNNNGGNVAITGPGFHRILQCSFQNGTSTQDGGNLYVRGADSVLVSRSIFDFGSADLSGAGAAFIDTRIVAIEASYFESNTAFLEGGGILVAYEGLSEDITQSTSIIETYFESNSAQIGGGFMLRDLGSSPSLLVLDCYFRSNLANRVGGAGGMLLASVSDSARILFTGNQGEDNDGEGLCPDFFAILAPSGDDFCVELSETFLFPDQEPTLPPSSPPNRPPPFPVPELYSCNSTTGPCSSDFTEFADRLGRARYNDTISVCGEMIVPQAIEIEQSNITICCNDTARCTLVGAGENQILSVTGANVTIIGLAFQNGLASNGGNGGNVAITGPGFHRILFCLFSGGFSTQFGGNLYVEGADSVLVSRSIFEFGSAEVGGAGAAFIDTRMVSVEGSYFESNEVELEGGGILVGYEALSKDIPQSTSFIETFFESNSAIVGGGFMSRDLGLSSRLFVVDCYFGANSGLRLGGAGAVFSNSSIYFGGNQGGDNFANNCPDFFADDGCFEVTEDFLSPDSVRPPTRPPTAAPSLPDPAPSRSCAPTVTEDCISDFEVLLRVLELIDSEANHVIALCGGFDDGPEIEIRQNNLTLCCVEFEQCLFSGSGNNRLLQVTGTNVTLQDLLFIGGRAGMDGGNVAIISGGFHSIFNCVFFDGISDMYGGNLMVRDATRVEIVGSHFFEGSANSGGGGLAVWDTATVVVQDSTFGNNNGGSTGGGVFLSYSGDGPHSTTFERTEFVGNSAEYGGGFLMTSIGELPQLVVKDSVFVSNEGTFEGGPGMVLNHRGGLELSLSSNTGESNLAGGDCDGFVFLIDSSEDIPECIPVTDDFP